MWVYVLPRLRSPHVERPRKARKNVKNSADRAFKLTHFLKIYGLTIKPHIT
jgi:hypothetical protein